MATHSPVFLPGWSHGQRSLAGYSPWGQEEVTQAQLAPSGRHRCGKNIPPSTPLSAAGSCTISHCFSMSSLHLVNNPYMEPGPNYSNWVCHLGPAGTLTKTAVQIFKYQLYTNTHIQTHIHVFAKYLHNSLAIVIPCTLQPVLCNNRSYRSEKPTHHNQRKAHTALKTQSSHKYIKKKKIVNDKCLH